MNCAFPDTRAIVNINGKCTDEKHELYSQTLVLPKCMKFLVYFDMASLSYNLKASKRTMYKLFKGF